jgi:ketosteroid isomerase-like protein
MSQENVEIVRRLHGAINAADDQATLALLDPEVVWVQNPNAPDPRTFHGHEGMREFREMLADAFEDVRLEGDQFLDPGGDQVVSLGYMRARGVGSGVEVREARAWVWTVRNGKVVRHQTYDSHESALEAAGLSE